MPTSSVECAVAITTIIIVVVDDVAADQVVFPDFVPVFI